MLPGEVVIDLHSLTEGIGQSPIKIENKAAIHLDDGYGFTRIAPDTMTNLDRYRQ